ncbi:hypothetical protein ACLOJK_001130 [Asimina triloba]
MASPNSLLLHERIPRRNTLQRLSDLIVLLLLVLFLLYRLLHFSDRGLVWRLALLCELWFTFMLKELPAVDMFVTTTDCTLEPPIITVNTVLSLLAVDYPANKVSCYVSDDGCSPITYYSLKVACGFAKMWVPFCKKYRIQARAPADYFSTVLPPENIPDYLDPSSSSSSHFSDEWHQMKEEYEELGRKIQVAVQQDSVPCHADVEFVEFQNIERSNHPSIVKVIWENMGDGEDGVPHLVYVSREKRPKMAHNFKAGAMNALLRVSGVMTNAPFTLNVDCDMFANNPEIVVHAMCFHLGVEWGQKEFAFMQFPQRFHSRFQDDPFGNEFLTVLQQIMGHGFATIQGPNYEGTGCFHRRKVMYGSRPEDEGIDVSKLDWMNAEDIVTGIKIHSMGWSSSYCTPHPPGFLGSAPSTSIDHLIQQKRWAIGLMEIVIGKHSPVVGTLQKRLRFRQCLMYMYMCTWPLRSLPELCYSMLPAFAILTRTSFLPKVSDPGMWVFVALFIYYNLYSLVEYRNCGFSVRAWWNNQRMRRITSASSWLFAVLTVFLKLLGWSEMVFEVTRKEQSPAAANGSGNEDPDAGRFTFNSSPLFLPGTTIVVVHIAALMVAVLRVASAEEDVEASGLGEMACSMFVLLNFLPIVKGLFGKGRYGIPWPTLCKATALGCIIIHWCIKG